MRPLSLLIALGLIIPLPGALAQETKTADPPKAKAETKKKADEPAAKKKRATPRPEHRHSDKTYMGREIAEVMSFLGADWLFRAERVEEEKPDEMLAALEITPGMTVADVGAGAGYHAVKLSKLVGAEGKVYATDVQPQMIAMLKRNAKASKCTNIVPVLCTPDDPKLPKDEVDLILMVDVYHECSEPEATLKGLRAALKPGGRLVLVEYRGEDPAVPIKPEHKMTVDQVKKEIEPQGFAFVKVDDFLPWQHILIFEKPKSDDLKPAATPPNR